MKDETELFMSFYRKVSIKTQIISVLLPAQNDFGVRSNSKSLNVWYDDGFKGFLESQMN